MNRYVILLLAAALSASPAFASTSDKITGDYVEARTASVFAGACHYNGELVTTGRDAVMAWSFTAGQWKQTDLAGARAMAVVTSTANLGEDRATRTSELVVDATTDAQAAAVAELIGARCADALGKIVTVRRMSIQFKHDGTAYAVNAAGFGSLAVEAMPDDACCTQPEMVWYAPLFSLTHRKVGYTQSAAYISGTLGDPWSRSDENSAFYGSFSF